MPTTTKLELKLGMATREAFGKALVDLGRARHRHHRDTRAAAQCAENDIDPIWNVLL